jgi:hypothetical protein
MMRSPTKMNKRCLCCRRVVRGWNPLFSATWWTTMREHGIDPATGHLASCRYSGIYDTGLIRRLRTNAAALLASREAHLLGLAKDFRDAAELIERLARVSLSLPGILGTDEIIEDRMAGHAINGGAFLGALPQHAAALSELFPTCFPADRGLVPMSAYPSASASRPPRPPPPSSRTASSASGCAKASSVVDQPTSRARVSGST